MKPKENPGPAATGTEGDSKYHKQPKTSTIKDEEQELRTALLAELRRDLLLSKIATLKIERLGVALKHRLISVRQCLALQRDPTTWSAIT